MTIVTLCVEATATAASTVLPMASAPEKVPVPVKVALLSFPSVKTVAEDVDPFGVVFMTMLVPCAESVHACVAKNPITDPVVEDE